ncbi:MAG TPA: VWA domain-containing protein, partial [Oceanospirillales bacterium]|nr:VWA domain-containing protein [Oceanospirillales bacterium]
MKILVKKTLLVAAIAAITACSQYDKNNSQQTPNQTPHKDKEEAEVVLNVNQQQSEQARMMKKPKATVGYAVGDQLYAKRVAVNPMSVAYPPQPIASNRENYAHFKDNTVKLVANEPVSTFSIDVDTGAYSNMRRMLNQGVLPPKDAVRVEEFINYFNYDYAMPKDKNQPFSINTELAPSPWNAHAKLLQIG